MDRVCLLLLTLSVGAIIAKKEETDSKNFLKQEAKSLPPCEIDSENLPAAVSLRRQGKIKESLSCLVQYLQRHLKSGWAWTNLGEAYRLDGQQLKARTAFKNAYRLDLAVLPYIRRFDWLGPLPVGKLEVDGDPAASVHGNVIASWRRKDKAIFYSELLSSDQELRWMEVDTMADPSGTVQVTPAVDWNDLINNVGSLALMEWQAWFVAEFAVNRDTTIVIRCLGVNTVWVDELMVNGDIYHREQFWFSLPINAGLHLFRVQLRSKRQAGLFRCEFSEQDSNTLAVHHPHFLPELLAARVLSGLVAVPVFNRNSKKWLSPASFRVTMASNSKDIPLSVSIADDIQKFPIAPGQLSTLILRLSNKNDVTGGVNACPRPKPGELDMFAHYIIRLAISDVGKSHEVHLKLRCRNYTNSFLFTFLDHDGSVQHAAAIAPQGNCSASGCPVMLSLHGTGVNPGNQADSYKHLENGHMVYGVNSAWLLAPTRHGAHNWEGPGALTALSAITALQQVVSANQWIPHAVDAERVVFAGHSMGGHGAWHVATHFPDKALAVWTAAGWNKKEEYADSNVFFRHDVSTSYAEPALKAVLESCIIENEADRHVSNLKGLPIAARVGAKDRTVHPYYLRRMRRVLLAAGIEMAYSEIAGKDHWWWDSITANDGGVTYDAEVRKFISDHTIPLAESCAKGKAGKCDDNGKSRYAHSTYRSEKARKRGQFIVTVTNPAFQGSVRGVLVLQQQIPLRQSTVKIILKADIAELQTVNVLRIGLTEPSLAPLSWRTRTVHIDGDDVSKLVKKWKRNLPVLEICRKDPFDKWSVCRERDSSDRLASSLGPARRVAEAPFLIVAGTEGDTSTANAIHQLAVYIANLFLLTSDTLAPIVKDSDLTSNTAGKHNLILIGGPSLNTFSTSVLSRVPLNISQSGISLGKCDFTDPTVGALVLAPHSGDHLALVLLGNSLEGLQNVGRLATPTIPPMTRSPFSNLLPDFVVTGPDFDSKGPGGYLCAGFWGSYWNWQPELSSCIC